MIVYQLHLFVHMGGSSELGELRTGTFSSLENALEASYGFASNIHWLTDSKDYDSWSKGLESFDGGFMKTKEFMSDVYAGDTHYMGHILYGEIRPIEIDKYEPLVTKQNV